MIAGQMKKKQPYKSVIIKMLMLLFLTSVAIGASVFFLFFYLFKSGQMPDFFSAPPPAASGSKVYRYPRLELRNLIKAKIFDINHRLR